MPSSASGPCVERRGYVRSTRRLLPLLRRLAGGWERTVWRRAWRVRAIHGEAGAGMVGELVMGRFRVIDRVGSGGMGTVYRAFDERLQRQVAVKEIAGVDARRVLREAQAAARLNHPGIVTLYELGSEGGRALLVSELVEGATLAELARCGDLSDREAAEFGADVCEALAHAHERGVVHRDVKPHNVIVRADDGVGRRAKLMDFGIASLAGAPALTATGEVVGTLAYMAPEQAEGQLAGEPADVYALALTLYELWAGTNPVARATPAHTAREIGGPLPPLRAYRPELPQSLIACVDACLHPEPESRPPLAELHRRLQAAGWLRATQLVALTAWGVAVTLVAAPIGRPGLALVLGVLTAPAILVASRLASASLPLLAPLLGALSLAPVYPAVAGSRGTALERGVLAALGWCWLLVGAATLGLGSRMGLLDKAPHGWSRSTSGAASALLSPLLTPEALLGAMVFALAALALGVVLRAGHVALALLGVLLWAAGLEGALRLVADGGLSARPLLIVAAALVAVIVEFRRRPPAPAGRPAPIPQARPAIQGGAPGGMP
ncbi:MAG: serine/threonine protein kinase [Actinobacteria bacterium]|nr:MAG: serine/threonine protein kinase [Actinomycetota bacterium]